MLKKQHSGKYWVVIGLTICLFLIISKIMAQNNQSELDAGTIAVDRGGFEMVFVPPGTVEMGISRENLNMLIQQGALGNIPVSEIDMIMNAIEEQGVFDTITVNVPSFWIDKYEVSIEQYESNTEVCVGLGPLLFG
jgi:formylglycine-generating enzyme required for sulfatase activity